MIDSIATLLGAIATLLWPAIVAVIIWLFRPIIGTLLESAKSREFSVEIGGQKLTMKEAGEQQRALIADLQARLVELRKQLEVNHVVLPMSTPIPASLPIHFPKAILWVDDHPKNNSYFIDRLLRFGITVDLATNTTEALSRFSVGRYDVIISDMARGDDSTAGLELLKEIRVRDTQIPFILFCGARSVKKRSSDAARLGANGITSSPTELFGLLNLEELKSKV